MIQKNIVSFPSTDGLLLHGMFFDSGHSKTVIHVHGLAGNFYSSMYHDSLSRIYASLGYNYLTFNNRGAEYVKQLKNITTGKSKFYGYTYEKFDESDMDILGAVNFLRQQNNQFYILQGHSSGCQKIAYTIAKHNLKPDATILLSPCDDIGLAIDHYGEVVFAEKISQAQKEDGGLLPSDFFFDMPVSKESFLSNFGPNNKFDIFHYYQPNVPFIEIEINLSNTLVVFGEKDYVKDLKIVGAVFQSFPNYTLQIIPQADHKYKGYEEKLAFFVYNYVKQHTQPK